MEFKKELALVSRKGLKSSMKSYTSFASNMFMQPQIMKEIIETTQLEFDKSAFLIDLVKHESGTLYIEIAQTINNNSKDGQTIKINPSVLSDIIKILQNYQSKIPGKVDHRTKHITEEDKQKIQDRYLIGVSLKDLALQFDQSEELIEMVLRNRGIQIVSNEIPKAKRWRGRKR